MIRCDMGNDRRYKFELTVSGASPQHVDNVLVQATQPLISFSSGATLNFQQYGLNFLKEANKFLLFSTAKN